MWFYLSKKHYILIILTIISLMVISSLVYFSKSKPTLSKMANEASSSTLYTNQNNEIATSTDLTTDKDNWQTYTNTDFGFSFQYPFDRYVLQNQNLKIDFNKDPGPQLTAQGSMIVNVYMHDRGYKSNLAPGLRIDMLSEESELGIYNIEGILAHYYSNAYSVQKIDINGKEWTKVTMTDQSDDDPTLLTEDKGIIYVIRYRLLYVDEPTIKKIASSITFTPSVPVTIKLLSPNGGEMWQPRQTYPISYEILNWNGRVAIDLERYHATNGPKAGEINSSGALLRTYLKKGTAYVKIEDFQQTGGNYKIRVCAGECVYRELGSNYYAESQEFMSIENQPN